MQNSTRNAIILIIVIFYCVCPDLFPGPVDDVLAIIIGISSMSKKQKKRKWLEN